MGKEPCDERLLGFELQRVYYVRLRERDSVGVSVSVEEEDSVCAGEREEKGVWQRGGGTVCEGECARERATLPDKM